MHLFNNFISGCNIPWITYGQDIVNFSKDNEVTMARALDDVKDAGGNCMRWWLHTNGSGSPSFTNGFVTGLHQDSIQIIRKVLEMAQARQLQVILCLWSFDMLQLQGQDITAMKNLLERPEYTHHYIEKALNPILNELGTHPAILSWEIFNEPEGMTETFGWSSVKVEMKSIQRSVNLIAAAIHKNAPGIPVSNGSWSMAVLTDIPPYYNYYRDDRLIEAGGDPAGVLDFYQVHYYPANFDNELSPFHNPADHWGLDKPILIGEFPNIGCSYGRASPFKSTKESFLYLLDNGYAGCLTWRWPVENSMGAFSDARHGINAVSARLKGHKYK